MANAQTTMKVGFAWEKRYITLKNILIVQPDANKKKRRTKKGDQSKVIAVRKVILPMLRPSMLMVHQDPQ